MDRAARLAEASADRQRAAFEKVGGAVRQLGGLIGTYLTVRAFEGLITGAIDAQDHLNDLAKRTQLTVEQIGGIGFASKQAGGDVDEAAQALGKLNLSIAKAAGGDKTLTEVFSKIGVSAKDASGNARNAGAVLVDVANKFASYADGPEKAAIGNALFGKSYQGIIPLLQDGGAALQTNIDYFNRYSGVTAQTAQAADAFNDSLTKLKLLQGAFGNELAERLLPLLQTLVDRFNQSKESGDRFATVADIIAYGLKGIASGAAFVVESLTAMSTRLDGIVQKAQVLSATLPAKTGNAVLDFANIARALTSGDLGRKFDGISTQVDADIDKAQKRYDRFVREINAPIANDYSNEGRGRAVAAGRAPSITKAGADGAGGVSEIERLIKKLNEQTIAELTAGEAAKELEKAQLELATNPKLASATAAQKQAYLELANGLDLLKAKFDQASSAQTQFRLAEIAGTEATNEALRQATLAQEEAFHGLIASTPTEQFKALNREFANLTDKFNAGAISEQAYIETAAILQSRLPQQFRKTADALEEIAVDAGRGIADALGNTVEDVLRGNFSNIGKEFENLLIKLAADAIKADIGRLIFGTGAGNGNAATTGWLGTILGLFGRATGGGIPAGGVSRIAENGFETFDVQGKTYLLNGSSAGKVTPGGGAASNSPVFNIQIAAGVQRSELLSILPQLKEQIRAEIVSSMRRPGFA